MRASVGRGSHPFRKGRCAAGNTSVGVQAAEQVAVTCCRHPTSAGEVGVVNTMSALRLSVGIEAEDKHGHLAPICTLGGRIEETRVQLQVLPVVVGEVVGRGRVLLDRVRCGVHAGPPIGAFGG